MADNLPMRLEDLFLFQLQQLGTMVTPPGQSTAVPIIGDTRISQISTPSYVSIQPPPALGPCRIQQPFPRLRNRNSLSSKPVERSFGQRSEWQVVVRWVAHAMTRQNLTKHRCHGNTAPFETQPTIKRANWPEDMRNVIPCHTRVKLPYVSSYVLYLGLASII